MDRGTQRCPCLLMEAGQCYTCTMISRGICSCEDACGWQGVCPYSEYMQQGGSIRGLVQDEMFPVLVSSKIFFAEDLLAVRLEVPAGLALSCQHPSAYIMAEALGWRVPLSLLRTGAHTGDSEAEQGSWIEVLIKVCGPKSKALAEIEGTWKIAGPYYNGLPGADRLKRLPSLLVARGTGAAPLAHLLECLEDRVTECILYIDDEGLPEPFLEEYFQGIVFQRIRLSEETSLMRTAVMVKETLQNKKEKAVLLVSPYYVKLLTQDLNQEERTRTIIPNPANLCCGMGVCGACSHTDRDGVTVRLCKCGQTVLE